MYTSAFIHRQYLTIMFRPPELVFNVDGFVNFIPSTTGVTQRFNQGIEQGDELSSFYIQEMFFDYLTEPWADVFRVCWIQLLCVIDVSVVAQL